MKKTRTLRIFVALALVAIAVLPLGRFLPAPVRGAGFTSGPVFHTSNGHFFAVQYDAELTQAEIDTASGYLNQYIPQLFSLFWEPDQDAYIVVTKGGCGGYSCGGSDGVSILPSSWNIPNVWVHELTHVLQFYGLGPGLYLGGDAFLLYAEPMAMTIADILAPFTPEPDCCIDRSLWTIDQGVGLASNDYALQAIGESHVPVTAWRMLYKTDPNIFKSLNSRLSQLTQQYVQISDIPSFRELIRQSTSVQAVDNLPIKQWLAVEGFLGRNELNGITTTYVESADYYSQGSAQQFAQVTAVLATPSGFRAIDTTQSRGTIYDAITKARLSDLTVESSTTNPNGVSFQANLDSQSPPDVIKVNLLVVAAGVSENRTILIPLKQYAGFFTTPSLGAKGFLVIPTSDMWLQPVSGYANVNGQTFPVTNGAARINLDGQATVMINTGTTTQVTGFLQSQQMALGLDYTALRIMQDTDTISTTVQTSTQTSSSSSTPTVTMVENTSTSTQTQIEGTSTSTQTSVTTQTSSQTTQTASLWTINPTTSSTSTEQTQTTTVQSITSITTQQQSPATDFHLSSSSDTVSLAQSSSGAFTVSIQSTGSFAGQVNLVAAGLPPGVEISFSPDPVTTTAGSIMTSTATLIVTRTVPTGIYPITVVASSGTVSKQIPLSLRVSGCLIATATFGSELAPEVEFLRDFRDNKLLQTFAGSSFMVAFNTWYYSFSPTVAQYESTNPTMRYSVKLTLQPLIWILRFGADIFDLLSFNQELAALISGVVVSMGTGAVYVSAPFLLVRGRGSMKMRRVMRRFDKVNFIAFIVALLAVTLGEIMQSGLTMTVASPVVLLTAIMMSAHWTSGAAAALLGIRK